jgi:hypothetical protein
MPYTDDNFTTPIYSAGTYTITLANSRGCDSVIYLTLTEYPYITYYSASFCSGGIYNDEHFANLNTAGTYYDTLKTINGCDSIIELTLTINLIPPVTKISDSIHLGDTCNFNGKQLTEAGIYYDTLQTIFGCDSIIELTLTVTSVGIVETQCIASLRVYPNPTTGELRITSNELRTLSVVEVYDIVEKKLLTFNAPLPTNEIIIDISHLANGLYFLKINNKIIKIIKH